MAERFSMELIDDAFVDKLLETKTPEEAQTLFKENGIELSLEEVNKLGEYIGEEIQNTMSESGEVTDEDMEKVAGGAVPLLPIGAWCLKAVGKAIVMEKVTDAVIKVHKIAWEGLKEINRRSVGMCARE